MARNWRASPLTFVSTETNFARGGISGELSLWPEIAVPGGPHPEMRVVSANAALETEHSPLARPLCGQIAHPRHAMAVR